MALSTLFRIAFHVDVNRAFSHDVTAAMLVFQTSPVGVEFLSYANAFFCSYELA